MGEPEDADPAKVCSGSEGCGQFGFNRLSRAAQIAFARSQDRSGAARCSTTGGNRTVAKADVRTVSELEVGPGELPGTMTAWVIRQDREGEPKDAFQIE